MRTNPRSMQRTAQSQSADKKWQEIVMRAVDQGRIGAV
jgi:hypothetical protein